MSPMGGTAVTGVSGAVELTLYLSVECVLSKKITEARGREIREHIDFVPVGLWLYAFLRADLCLLSTPKVHMWKF